MSTIQSYSAADARAIMPPPMTWEELIETIRYKATNGHYEIELLECQIDGHKAHLEDNNFTVTKLYGEMYRVDWRNHVEGED